MQGEQDAFDWAARWRGMVENWGQSAAGGLGGGGDRFERMARRFSERLRDGTPEADPLLPMIVPLARGGTVIDVGAGIGRHTLPLAAVARAVVAVEPSEAMRRGLEARLRAEGSDNVRVVPGTFESAALEPADLVLCAHVVYFVADLPAFVRKADALARHAVAIVVRHDPMPFPALALWSRYRSDPPPEMPRFADLYNLLLELGYAPNVSFYRRRYDFNYASAEEALADASRFLGRPVTPEDAHSLVGPHSQELREACIWWEN